MASNPVADDADDEMVQVEAKVETEEVQVTKNKIPAASLCKLFSMMDFVEVVVLIVGCLGAIGNGLSQPLLCIVSETSSMAWAKPRAGQSLSRPSRCWVRWTA